MKVKKNDTCIARSRIAGRVLAHSPAISNIQWASDLTSGSTRDLQHLGLGWAEFLNLEFWGVPARAGEAVRRTSIHPEILGDRWDTN